MTNSITIENFKGIRNDEEQKHVSMEEGYFYDVRNFEYSETGMVGMSEILFPERINNIGTQFVDGLFEYRFLDSDNDIQVQQIGVCGGTIYKDILTTEVALKTGISIGKCSFVVFNDRLYIANGKDYVWVYDGNSGMVSQMGAPIAVLQTATGFPNGTYYYAMSYVTSGGEEVLGSVSNSVSAVNQKVLLNIPIGYAGTTSRKIYRTVAGGTQLKLLYTVSENTSLTYLDNIADGSLTTDMPAVGDQELPKVYHLVVAYQRLCGAKCDKYPTQIFPTDTNVDVIDVTEGLDVANYGTDNTPVIGIGSDFNNLVVGTEKNIILVDYSSTSVSVSVTRSNVGMKSGYSIVNIPSYGDFAGGLMFVSSQDDIRLMEGLNKMPVATSFDNIRTQDWANNIRGSLSSELKTAKNISAIFYKYKYYLVLDSKVYTFDIRTKGWSTIIVKTIASEYVSTPTVFGIFDKKLYNGQPDGWIELQHSLTTYRDEEVKASMISGSVDTSDKYKYIECIKFWFISSAYNDINITVTTDSDEKFSISNNFTIDGGVFDGDVYDEKYFDVDYFDLDYRVVNINRACRWIKYEISNSYGSIDFHTYSIHGDVLANKETVA